MVQETIVVLCEVAEKFYHLKYQRNSSDKETNECVLLCHNTNRDHVRHYSQSQARVVIQDVAYSFNGIYSSYSFSGMYPAYSFSGVYSVYSFSGVYPYLKCCYYEITHTEQRLQ